MVVEGGQRAFIIPRVDLDLLELVPLGIESSRERSGRLGQDLLAGRVQVHNAE